MSVKRKKIAILGGGAWGTALAEMAARQGHHLRLYARDKTIVEDINIRHTNSRYLPDITLNQGIHASDDAKWVLEGAEIILVVIPAQALSSLLLDVRASIAPHIPLILCAKGIERASGRFMSDVARAILPHQPIGVLSGPSFAADVARGLPTAVTIAAARADLARDLAQFFSCASFRCYASDDMVGVELGGALKNVLAVGAGAANGRGLGLSAQAALVTRGFAELRRIGHALGARPETMNGLAVLGDLMLTCSSPQSRNYSYGFALGKGLDVGSLPLAEGVATAPMAVNLCEKYGIDAPIFQAIAALLDGRLAIDEAVDTLLTRPLKVED